MTTGASCVRRACSMGLVAAMTWASPGFSQQPDTRLTVVQASDEQRFDDLAAKLRPEADKRIGEVRRCINESTRDTRLACVARAEAAATEYLTAEKSLYESRAKGRRATVDFLKSEVGKLEREGRTPARSDVTEAWLGPMAASVRKELQGLEDQARRVRELSESDRDRLTQLRKTDQTFTDFEELENQREDIKKRTEEYRALTLKGYNNLIIDLQALAGLDSSRAGVFEAQIGLTRMFLSNERQRIEKLSVDQEAKRPSRPRWDIPSPSGTEGKTESTDEKHYRECIDTGRQKSDCDKLLTPEGKRFLECLEGGKLWSDCEKLLKSPVR